MTTEDRKLFRRQMFNAALGAMLVICLPAWGSIYWMRTKDHFKIQNKVDREEYQLNYYQLTLLLETKSRALESIALANKGDIEDLTEHINELKEAQAEMDKMILREFRTRDITQNTLPEY